MRVFAFAWAVSVLQTVATGSKEASWLFEENLLWVVSYFERRLSVSVVLGVSAVKNCGGNLHHIDTEDAQRL
jgi:hypothetical protein